MMDEEGQQQRRQQRRQVPCKLDAALQHLAEVSGEHWRDGSDGSVLRLRRAPTAAEFARLVRRNVPVVFEGLCADWPATRRWTRSYLESAVGTAEVTVAVTPNGRGDAVTDVPWKNVTGVLSADGSNEGRTPPHLESTLSGSGHRKPPLCESARSACGAPPA